MRRARSIHTIVERNMRLHNKSSPGFLQPVHEALRIRCFPIFSDGTSGSQSASTRAFSASACVPSPLNICCDVDRATQPQGHDLMPSTKKKRQQLNNRTCTFSRKIVPVSVSEQMRIPLALVDVHNRSEQLPFAYFFRSRLSQSHLLSSLQKVLRSFPTVGGTIDWSGLAIIVGHEDGVAISFGNCDETIDDWVGRGHSMRQESQPKLLCLFDSLEPTALKGDGMRTPLANIRVTYMGCGGTCIGVNFSHALADASSCVRFVECWGREMRGLNTPSLGDGTNDRAGGTTGGMMTPFHAEALNLGPWSYHAERERNLLFFDQTWEAAREKMTTFVPDWISTLDHVQETKPSNEGHEATSIQPKKNCSIKHSYLSLDFSPTLLRAMKAYGMVACSGQSLTEKHESSLSARNFVSTNDMVIALGWILQRQVSGRHDWGMSVLVNLRGRGGINDFSPLGNQGVEAESNYVPECNGLFGNGIMNVVASLPPSKEGVNESSLSDTPLKEVADAARAIRAAITVGIRQVPELIASSRIGRPIPPPSLAAGTFCTTSWRAFPMWDTVQFERDTGRLAGFHGYPAYPLPTGRTYAAVVVPTREGGCSYQLLAPSCRASRAKKFHKILTEAFLNWHRTQ